MLFGNYPFGVDIDSLIGIDFDGNFAVDKTLSVDRPPVVVDGTDSVSMVVDTLAFGLTLNSV